MQFLSCFFYLWSVRAIPTYRVYRFYDNKVTTYALMLLELYSSCILWIVVHGESSIHSLLPKQVALASVIYPCEKLNLTVPFPGAGHTSTCMTKNPPL